MKLSVKIFLGICIPSVIVSFIISMFVVNKNFETNIEAERVNLIQNIKGIEKTLNSNKDISADKILTIIAKSYNKKKIDLAYYNNGNLKYTSNQEIKKIDDVIIKPDEYTVKTETVDNDNFAYALTQIDDNSYIMCSKNINNIYEMRDELIKNCVFIVSGLIIIIAIVAYLISKTITRPLNKMKKEMEKISKGDYNIHLKEGRHEFGELAKSFNNMSKEIKDRNNQLVEYANSKQVFIDDLSHEMNTPLTSIQGYAELLEKASLTDEQKAKYLKYIQDESKRIQDMYKKLLLISYKKNSDFEKVDVNVNNVFKEVTRGLKNKIDENKIDLVINNNLNTILGDETLIIMCVSNLVKNAINVSKIGGRIIINAFEMDGKKYIQVIDQGIGISKENIKKITEPFYRVDKVRSRKNGGAGIGLSICKSIMEMHEGELKVESELSKGSVFILEFK